MVTLETRIEALVAKSKLEGVEYSFRSRSILEEFFAVNSFRVPSEIRIDSNGNFRCSWESKKILIALTFVARGFININYVCLHDDINDDRSMYGSDSIAGVSALLKYSDFYNVVKAT